MGKGIRSVWGSSLQAQYISLGAYHPFKCLSKSYISIQIYIHIYIYSILSFFRDTNTVTICFFYIINQVTSDMVIKALLRYPILITDIMLSLWLTRLHRETHNLLSSGLGCGKLYLHDIGRCINNIALNSTNIIPLQQRGHSLKRNIFDFKRFWYVLIYRELVKNYGVNVSKLIKSVRSY